MNTGKVAIVGLVASLAVGGGVAALADTSDDRVVRAIEMRERDDGALRKDDAGEEIAAVDEDDNDRTGDRDRTSGDDGTSGGDNTTSYDGGGTDDGGSGGGTSG